MPAMDELTRILQGQRKCGVIQLTYKIRRVQKSLNNQDENSGAAYMIAEVIKLH